MPHLLRWLLLSHLYLTTPHPCRPCHMKSGPLADVEVTNQPLTQAVQNDPTSDDNDGGSDDDDTPGP